MKTKLEHLICKDFCPEQLALVIRRFKEETVHLILKTPDEEFKKEWIYEGNYWLTKFCEILDPQLEK